MRKMVLLPITVAFVFAIHAFATLSFDHWPDVAGPYLGQEPPGMKAKIFAPGIISTDRSEINSVFAPDRDEFYFTVWTRETGMKIMVTSQIDGRWSAPEVASFSNDISDVDPAISYDGEKVFFSTRRPRPGESEARKDGFGKGDLYVSFRSLDGSWSPLKNMGDAINSDKRDFCPMVTPDGKYFFFSSKREGDGDIFWIDARVIDTLRDD